MQSSTNKDKNKIIYIYIYLILCWLGFFLFFLSQSIHSDGAKNFSFQYLKSYFIYFTISFYNTSNIKCFNFFYHFIQNNIKKFIKIIKKSENLSFLIEVRDIILIKYCILFLTTCYSQLVFISVYYSCKKFSSNFTNNTRFCCSLIVK